MHINLFNKINNQCSHMFEELVSDIRSCKSWTCHLCFFIHTADFEFQQNNIGSHQWSTLPNPVTTIRLISLDFKKWRHTDGRTTCVKIVISTDCGWPYGSIINCHHVTHLRNTTGQHQSCARFFRQGWG